MLGNILTKYMKICMKKYLERMSIEGRKLQLALVRSQNFHNMLALQCCQQEKYNKSVLTERNNF